MQVDPGADWIVSGNGSAFINDGTIQVAGDLILGNLTRDAGQHGVIALGNAGIAEFTAAVGKGETLVFTDNTGTVLLDRPLRFNAVIAGFAAGDVIDLAGRAADGLSFADHHLLVTENGAAVADLHFAGHYTTADFALSPDGNGGTEIALLGSAAASLWAVRS